MKQIVYLLIIGLIVGITANLIFKFWFINVNKFIANLIIVSGILISGILILIFENSEKDESEEAFSLVNIESSISYCRKGYCKKINKKDASINCITDEENKNKYFLTYEHGTSLNKKYKLIRVIGKKSSIYETDNCSLTGRLHLIFKYGKFNNEKDTKSYRFNCDSHQNGFFAEYKFDKKSPSIVEAYLSYEKDCVSIQAIKIIAYE